MTSSDLRDRSARPCSPSAQRSASARLLLPEPFGPTTALMPGPNSTFVRSAKDLNPWSRSASRRGSAGRASSGPGRRARRTTVERHRPDRRVARPEDDPDLLHRLRRGGRLCDPPRRPLADAQPLPVDPDLDAERLLVVGPGRVHEPVRRPVAGMSLGVLLEPALGTLERDDRRFGDQLGRRQAHDPVTDRPGSRDRGRAHPRPPRTSMRGATAGADRCAAPHPRREAETSRGRSGSRPGRDRSSRRSRRGGRSGTPRPRRDGERRAPRRWPG